MQFELADGTRLGWPDPDGEDDAEDATRTRLSRLHPGEQFVYEFDLGDGGTHLCSVDPPRIDPVETLGILPDARLPYWGWGAIPDRSGRRWDDDDGQKVPPPDPGLTSLPPLRPWWGAPEGP
jgi:hypothetical protein